MRNELVIFAVYDSVSLSVLSFRHTQRNSISHHLMVAVIALKKLIFQWSQNRKLTIYDDTILHEMQFLEITFLFYGMT